MQYLTKAWVRILISLLLAGMVTELLAVASGHAHQRRELGGVRVMVIAIVFYLILTAVVKRQNRGF